MANCTGLILGNTHPSSDIRHVLSTQYPYRLTDLLSGGFGNRLNRTLYVKRYVRTDEFSHTVTLASFSNRKDMRDRNDASSIQIPMLGDAIVANRWYSVRHSSEKVSCKPKEQVEWRYVWKKKSGHITNGGSAKEGREWILFVEVGRSYCDKRIRVYTRVFFGIHICISLSLFFFLCGMCKRACVCMLGRVKKEKERERKSGVSVPKGSGDRLYGGTYRPRSWTKRYNVGIHDLGLGLSDPGWRRRKCAAYIRPGINGNQHPVHSWTHLEYRESKNESPGTSFVK